MLAKARAIVARKGAELYGEAGAEWFMRAHGNDLLSADGFDPRVGFNVCVRLPALPA